MSIIKKIKKGAKKVKNSPVTETAGEISLEVAESTPPGEVVAAIIAENEQENNN